MKEKFKFLFISLRTWQLILFSVIGAVLITDLITALVSLWVWHEIQINLIVLGTINAILVPLVILPLVIRNLRRVVKLEEENQSHLETISQFGHLRQMEEATQRRADEMSLLYQLGILLASGGDLHDTLLALQNEILKLIQVDAFFIAIYDEKTDLVEYPIFFEKGKPQRHSSRRLSEHPGLTGAVIYGKVTLYLEDMMADVVVDQYAPVDDNDLVLHTFLGIPLVVNGKLTGVLSVQSGKTDAYSQDQIQLMENVAVQAAIAIDKVSLLDQVKQELVERKRAEGQLRDREAILEAVTFAAEQFLKTPDWRAKIDIVLERLGKIIHATHAYLFEHHIGADGIENSSLNYEWTAPGYPSDFDNPYYQTPHPLNTNQDSTDYYLRQGDIFIGNLSNFPAAEKERLGALGVKRMVELPVFVDGKWWGTFGLDDFESERDLSHAEVDALKIAVGMLGAAIQREKAESALRESERIYRRAIEAADAIPYYRDFKNNRYTFMGEGILEITGYSAAEMTPETWDQLKWQGFPRGNMAHLTYEQADRLTEEGILRHWECDYRIVNRHGQTRWVADSCIQIRDEEDVRIGVIGILQDITDRKLTEAKLRKRESILEAITFAAEQFLRTPNWREGIDIVLERLGREINASHAYLFEKHLGADRVLLNSLRYEWVAEGQKSDLDNPAYQNAPLDELDFMRYYEILDSGEPFIGSASYFTENEKAWMDSTGIKALLEMRILVDGKQWGTIGFDDTVNEREWTAIEVDVIRVATSVLGAAIKRQLDESALQKELNQRKLLIDELESKNTELEQFTYTVSHDLKSPLVTINGFIGYLEKDASSGNTERLKSDIQRIQEAVNKMQRLLNELLELSRIGRMMNAPQSVAFDDLVREAMELVHGQLEEREVTVHSQPNLPSVYGDKPRLVEVLQNLFDNAAKYMGDQAEPLIEIGQRGEDAERGKSIFYVKDNGMGIAPEYHERIFGLFNKLDPKAEGTGVGLSIVKRIVEFHGGRIWVESEAGIGSTFFFSLPSSAQPKPDSVI